MLFSYITSLLNEMVFYVIHQIYHLSIIDLFNKHLITAYIKFKFFYFFRLLNSFFLWPYCSNTWVLYKRDIFVQWKLEKLLKKRKKKRFDNIEWIMFFFLVSQYEKKWWSESWILLILWVLFKMQKLCYNWWVCVWLWFNEL